MFRICRIACITLCLCMVSLSAQTEIPQSQSNVTQDSVMQESRGGALLKAL